MTVKDLADYLSRLDPDMEVLEQRYSDYGPMSMETWEVVLAVSKDGGAYSMRVYPEHFDRMSADDQGAAKKCLLFKGN